MTARAVYRRQDLLAALEPRSVAIVGATPTPTAAGSRAVKQLQLLGFGGRIDLVNAKYEMIGDAPCHPSVSALPQAPDSVIITAPRAAVEGIVLDAVNGGAKSAIIFAAGYAETGREEGRLLQDRLSAIARESGIRIIGPNCLGAVNYAAGAALTYTNTPVRADADGRPMAPHAHSIGVVSQSGGLGFAAAQALLRGVSFSHLLTSGNSCDVDVADLLAYLAEDPACTAIACVFEAIPQPERLLEAAAIALAAGKPIIINKLGTGIEGAAAAMTHSGMLAGSQDAYLAAVQRAGMTVVDNFEDLIETAGYFAKARPSQTRGVVVLASSGGASVMAADKAEAHGVALPQPGEAVREGLQARLPDFGTARNPCDVTGGVANDLETFFACVDMLMDDPAYDQLVTAHPYSVHTANRVRSFAELAAKHGKLVNNVWITEFLAGPGLAEAEADANSTVFRSMDRCFAAIAAWHRWEDRRAARLAEPARVRLADDEAIRVVAARLVADRTPVIAEREAKALLAAYGVPVVRETLAQDAASALAAAAAIGFPVSMKVESPQIPHKTEAGVIRLNVRDAHSAAQAYAEITAAAARVPGAHINGVLVQPMIPPGVEVMVGARVDPVFGPMLMVGLGGVFVEMLKDTVVAQAPVSAHQARAMLGSLRGAAMLTGFRGSPPVDQERLADAIARLSELIADHPASIAEFDVNPLICSADAVVAVDALIVRRAPG